MTAPHAHDHHHSPISFTGERVLPDDPAWAWCFQAHKFGYDDLAARVQPGQTVLDIGSGEGYGAAQLATVARVVACDVAEEAVRHGAERYGRSGIDWLVCDAQRLPFRDRAFDVVSSLQVIEHFTDTESHLAGVARIMKDDGWHYVATPNIDKMSEEEADNEFHLRDFTVDDLAAALRARFDEVDVLGMFYKEASPRVRAMRAAEAAEDEVRPRVDRIERMVGRLPGPLRVRIRPALRRLAGIRGEDSTAARNAILAEDFEARGPAAESFCLIGIARSPKR